MDWPIRNFYDDAAASVNNAGVERDAAAVAAADADADSGSLLRDALQTPARLATIDKEARETFPHHLNAKVDEVSNLLGPNETPEDVLKRTSKVWAERYESARLYKEKLEHLEGTPEFVEEYKKFRSARVKACYEALNSGKFDHLLTRPVTSSRDWYKSLKQQFVLVPNQYSNLTYFGNIVAAVATDFEVIANPGQNMTTMFLIRAACLAAPRFNTKQSLMVLLAGDASTAKSYLMSKNGDMLPPGWTMSMAHLSAMALSSATNDDFRSLMVEELPASMTQETFEQTGRDNGASFLKSLLTNKIVNTSTLSVDKGQRTAPERVASKMMTGVFGTNSRLVPTSALLKRYMVHRASHDPEITEKINRLEATALTTETQNAKLREQIIAHLVQLAELMIGMGAIKLPDMDAFVILWDNLRREMRTLGYDLIEPKSIVSVEQVVRSFVVMKAVCAAVLSEKNYQLRIDEQTGEPKRFEDHYQEHFANIESMLVAEEPEILFGISLCSEIFGDNTEGKLLEAARRLIGVKFTDADSAFKLTKTPQMMPTGVHHEVSGAQVDYECQYLEVPVETRGENQVIEALIGECTEKPSFNNAKIALEAMTKKTVQHVAMQYDRGCEFGQIVPRADGGGEPRSSPMIKKCEFSDDYEALLLSVANSGKKTGGGGSSNSTKLKPRWYVNIEAMRHYMAPAQAMKLALSKLQHEYTMPARHIICSPIIAQRHAHTQNEHTFHGIFDYLDFAPNPDRVLKYYSPHTVLPLQSESLRSEYMFDGGDPSLRNISQEAFDNRTVVRTNRMLASQTPVVVVKSQVDWAVVMKRQYECSMPMADAKVAHWSEFADFCREIRKIAGDIFAMRDDIVYPDELIAQAQVRNLQIDTLTDDHSSPQQKLATSFDTLVMSNLQTIPSVSCSKMRKVYRLGGMQAVCDLFVDDRCSKVKLPSLSAHSRDLIEQDETLSAIWPTARVIYENYKEPMPMIQQLLRFIGIDIDMGASGIFLLTRCDASDDSVPWSSSSSPTKKRITRAEDEPAISKAFAPARDEPHPLLKRVRNGQQSALHSTVDSSINDAYVNKSRTELAANATALFVRDESRNSNNEPDAIDNAHTRVRGTPLVRRY